MRGERSLMGMLSLVVAMIIASVVSPSAAVAYGSALGVVFMYGVMLHLARWRQSNAVVTNAIAMIAIGAVAAVSMAEFLRRWSAAVGLSPTTGTIVWSVIIAVGLACDSLATRWQRTHGPATSAQAQPQA
jgi:hypothetical protein